MKRKSKRILISTLSMLSLFSFGLILAKNVDRINDNYEAIVASYSIADPVDNTKPGPTGYKTGLTYGYSNNIQYGNTPALVLDSSWCQTETLVKATENGYSSNHDDELPDNQSLWNESYECSDELVTPYETYHHGYYKSDTYENNAHTVTFNFYELDQTSAYYGYYGVIVSLNVHSNGNKGVGYSEVGTEDIYFSIKDSNNNTLYVLNDITDYNINGDQSDKYYTSYMSFLVAPGTYNFYYRIDTMHANYSDLPIEGSVDFDSYKVANSDTYPNHGNNNEVNGNYIELEYYASISSQWSLDELTIESWLSGITVYQTTTLTSILQVLNPRIYTSFNSEIISTSTNIISENNVKIQYYNSQNQLIHSDWISNEINETSYVSDNMKIDISWNNQTETFVNINPWLYIYAPTVVSTSSTSADIVVNTTDSTKISRVQISMDGGYTYVDSTFTINGNAISFTINNLQSNTYYDNVYIKINNTSDEIKVPPFYTSYVAVASTSITNTVSTSGTDALVQVNYASQAERQIISYSLNGGPLYSVNSIDSSMNYDQFVISNLTPNTYYDLKVYNNGTEVTATTYDIFSINKDAIISVETSNITNSSVTIKITMQSSLTGYINQFNYYYTLDGGQTVTQITDSNTEDEYITFTINNLTPDTRYTMNFFVENKELNNAGYTTKVVQSQSIIFTTLLNAPADTTGKTVTNTINSDGNSTKVKVNYANPVPAQEIQYSIDGGLTWTNAVVESQTTNDYYDYFTISNLNPNTYYDLEIKIAGEQINTTVNNIYTITSQAITNVSVSSETATSVTLRVDYASGLHFYKQDLNLYYSINGEPQVEVIDESSIEDGGYVEFTIDGLTSGLFYSIEFWVEDPNLNNGSSTTKIYQDINYVFTKT